MDVQTVCAIFFEEELLEVSLELRLGYRLKHSDRSLLTIELVLVGGKLLTPNTVKILLQVLIPLANRGHHCTNSCLKLFISHSTHLLTHLCHMNVEARANVHAIFGWGLNQEPSR